MNTEHLKEEKEIIENLLSFDSGQVCISESCTASGLEICLTCPYNIDY